MIDPSAISRSNASTSKENLFRKDLLNGKIKSIDKIFPLYDQIFQYTQPNSMLCNLTSFYVYFQIIFTSFWSLSRFWLQGDSSKLPLIRYLNTIFWFIPSNPNESSLMYTMIVLSILFIFVISWYIGVLVYFFKNHRFALWSLYFPRIISENLCAILIFPTTSFIGYSIQGLINGKPSYYWAFFFFGAIYLFTFVFLFFIFFSLSCKSAYIAITPISMFSPSLILILYSSNICCVFFSHVSSFFGQWSIIMFQIIHMFFSGFCIFNGFFLPFHKLTNTIIAMVFTTTSALIDLIMIILYFLPKSSFLIVIIPLFISLVGSGIAYYFILSRRQEKIVYQLNNISGSNEDEKYAGFDNINFIKNIATTIMYLQVGFTQHCASFINLDIIKYLVPDASLSLLISCAQLIVFFPGENRQLNSIINQITQTRNLSFNERFLLYQIFKIKTLRASSANMEASDRLAELKAKTSIIENHFRGFWHEKMSHVSSFELIETECRQTNALWLETIRDYPNSSKFAEEYSKFLIDCMTDFDAALVQKQKSILIESGSHFSIDYSFRSMVRAFPEYLKMQIVDSKGNLKLQRKTNAGKASYSISGSTGNTSSYGNPSYVTSFEIDGELEASLGKTLLTHPKMRLALHHAIKGRKTFSIEFMPLIGAIITFSAIIIYVFLYSFIYSKFEERGNSMNRLSYIGRTRYNIGFSLFSLIMDYAKASNLFNESKLIAQLEEEDTNLESFVNLDGDMTYYVMYYVDQAKTYFRKLVQEIADLSYSGIKVFGISDEILNDVVNGYVCVEQPGQNPPVKVLEDPESTYLSNLKVILVMELYLLGDSTGKFTSERNFMMKENSCEAILQWTSIQNATNTLFDAFSNEQILNGYGLSKILFIFEIAIPSAFGIIVLFPTIIMIIKFIHDVDKMGDALLSLSPNVKEECLKPIRKGNFEEDEFTGAGTDGASVSQYKTGGLCISSIFLVIVTIMNICLCIGMLTYADATNTNISTLNRWEYYASQRVTNSVDTLVAAIMTVLVNTQAQETFWTRQQFINLLNSQLDVLQKNNEALLIGDESSGSKACLKFDSILDSLNFNPICEDSSSFNETHSIYRCLPSTHVITTYTNYLIGIIDHLDEYNGEIKSDFLYHMIHIANTHVWSLFEKVLLRILDLGMISYHKLTQISVAFLIGGILLGGLGWIMCLNIKQRMQITYDGVLAMIKHMPPIELINSKQIINLLLNKSEVHKNEGMSMERTILNSLTDCIICTNSSGVIEIVNPATTNTMGYTPEQILGQSFSMFLSLESKESVEKQLALMKSDQSPPLYEIDCVCVNDRELEFPAHITIIGMLDRNGKVDSFAFIIRDETLQVQQQKEAEEAKAQSENLLFQILPREIVIKLNRGEKEITFTVPSATIIFIDIVRFSEYSANLTPEQIMGNLSLIFASFDMTIKKYPLLYKIKLIGDVYMAAGGLFNPEEPPETHAEQTIKFGLDVLTELEEINVKLNSNLAVRIGVNTGGPVIGGVLGTDKPVFDIIGDPINVAARLQSTDIPGRIQIPTSTYELIKDKNYEIEERGEVFLKGKGKTIAYFVRPYPNFMSQLTLSTNQSLDSKKEVPSVPSIQNLFSSTMSNN